MELHPEKITPYTVKDDKAKTNNNPKSKSTKTARVEKGITAQLHKLKNKVNIGAKTKLKVEAFVGTTDSFTISLTASATGLSLIHIWRCRRRD